MPDFDIIDALRKLRYGKQYADQKFSSPEDKALAVASGAGANASRVLGNAGMDIVNAYAPRAPEDRVTGKTAGQSLGEQTSEAARKNPGAAVTGNLAVTAPLRTAATLAAGPASLPAEALLQGALGGLEGAYAAQEGDRLSGAARGAATGAALPVAVGAARGLGQGLANMRPPAGGAPAVATSGGSGPRPPASVPASQQAQTNLSKPAGRPPAKPPARPTVRPKGPPPKEQATEAARGKLVKNLPPATEEAEAVASKPIPRNKPPIEAEYEPNYGPTQEQLDADPSMKWGPDDVAWNHQQDLAAQRAARGYPLPSEDAAFKRARAADRSARGLPADPNDRGFYGALERGKQATAKGLNRGQSLHDALRAAEAPNATEHLPTQIAELSGRQLRSPGGKGANLSPNVGTVRPPAGRDAFRSQLPTQLDARPDFRARRAEARRPDMQQPGASEYFDNRSGGPLSERSGVETAETVRPPTAADSDVATLPTIAPPEKRNSFDDLMRLLTSEEDSL